MSETNFRRYSKRYEAEGTDGLLDRRFAKVPQNRVSVDTVIKMLMLFDTQYWHFPPKHSHEKLVSEHKFTQSYNFVRLTLHSHGCIQKAPRHGTHRRKRERWALPGMMLHQDGSSHEWVQDKCWDHIVIMDYATIEVYSAFLVEEEGTIRSFIAVEEVIRSRGLLCSLSADRASHYLHTSEASGKVDKSNPTQFGRAMIQLGVNSSLPAPLKHAVVWRGCLEHCGTGCHRNCE